MSGHTGTPTARVALPDACPRCRRPNERGRGWVEYTGNPDYPVVGCGACGHVVYVADGEPGWAADVSRETAPLPGPVTVCDCGHRLAHHRATDHPSGPGCWRCACTVAP